MSVYLTEIIVTLMPNLDYMPKMYTTSMVWQATVKEFYQKKQIFYIHQNVCLKFV